jgi:hypothetical protein
MSIYYSQFKHFFCENSISVSYVSQTHLEYIAIALRKLSCQIGTADLTLAPSLFYFCRVCALCKLSCQICTADLALCPFASPRSARPFGLAERASPYHTKEKNRIIHASMQMRFFSFVWHGSCLNQIFVYSVTFFFCNTTTTAAAAIANTATA